MQKPTSSTGPRSQAATFDETAARYEEEIQQGVSLTGETREFFAAQRLTWVARQLAALGVHPRSVLDFGCGTGGSVPFFFSAFPELKMVVGVDPSPLSLDVARRDAGRLGLNARFFPTAGEALAASGQVDLAFCNGVFHHIMPPDRSRVMADVRTLLAPNCWFAFSENNPWNPMMRYAMSRVSFDKDAILISPPAAKKLLRTAGFDVHRLDFLFFFPRILGFCRPMEKYLKAFPLGAQYLFFAQKG